MGLRAEEFDRLHSHNKLRILNIEGIPVLDIKLTDEKFIILYSVYHFFIEAVVNTKTDTVLSMERLSLDQVIESYCEDISSLE